MLLDEGLVTYDLDRHEHAATTAALTLLPPHVPHDGRAAAPGEGFRKRVLYLDPEWLPELTLDAVITHPTLDQPHIVGLVNTIHRHLRKPGDDLSAEVDVLSLREQILDIFGTESETSTDAPLASKLRDMLDDRLTENFTIAEAATLLDVNRSHLVRVFTQNFGIAPHQYVIGRRVDRARRLLLQGIPAAEVAVEAGFHDQSHLTRHFHRFLGITPGALAA